MKLNHGDSQLVIGQVNGTCEAKEERMKKYLGKVKQCIKSFTTTQFQHIPMEDNVEADVLDKTASADKMVSDQIKVQYIPSIDIPEVHQIDEVANWTTPIVSHLKDGHLLKDKEEARKLRVRKVHPYGRGVVQEGFFTTLFKMFDSRRVSLRPKRCPRRSLWKELGGYVPRS